MQPLEPNATTAWIESFGIAPDPDYPGANYLAYPDSHWARFWVTPADPRGVLQFVSALLDGLAPWAHVTVLPRGGHWPARPGSGRAPELIREYTLHGLGLPDGSGCAARFDDTERGEIAALLFPFLAFGWCGDDDLYLIPNHARVFLQTDHHDVVHAVFSGAGLVEPFVRHMAGRGFQLPTEPPDWTFKWPDWMPKQT